MNENKTQTQLFRTPFHLAYWKMAGHEVRDLQKLVLAALFVAMRVAISMVRIPVADNLYIYVGFMVTSVGAMIYGPVLALFGAFASDILSFFIFSGGDAFFLGYTLSEMLGALIYALFLYRTRISIVRIFISKLLVNGFVNLFLGSLWSAMMYSKGFYYYFAKSIIKNTVLLPIEVIVMVVLIQAMMVLAHRFRLMPAQPSKKIPFI